MRRYSGTACRNMRSQAMKLHGDEPASFSTGAGRGSLRLSAEVRVIGVDILIAVWGGTHPHIGAVAVAVPRPSRVRDGKMSATASVYNFLGHKDDAVARLCAERIAAHRNRKAVCVAGIHIDALDMRCIKKILVNAKELSRRIEKKLADIRRKSVRSSLPSPVPAEQCTALH